MTVPKTPLRGYVKLNNSLNFKTPRPKTRCFWQFTTWKEMPSCGSIGTGTDNFIAILHRELQGGLLERFGNSAYEFFFLIFCRSLQTRTDWDSPRLPKSIWPITGQSGNAYCSTGGWLFISRLRNTYGPTFKHRDLRPYLQLLGLPGSLKARPLKPAEAPDPRLGGQARRDAIDYTQRELFPWTRLTSKLETHKDR